MIVLMHFVTSIEVLTIILTTVDIKKKLKKNNMLICSFYGPKWKETIFHLRTQKPNILPSVFLLYFQTTAAVSKSAGHQAKTSQTTRNEEERREKAPKRPN